MSNLFKQNMTLPEMERLLEQYCKNDGTAINVTEKIPLSRDDMVLMRSYLDTFVNLKGDVSAFYDVNLAIIFQDFRSIILNIMWNYSATR